MTSNPRTSSAGTTARDTLVESSLNWNRGTGTGIGVDATAPCLAIARVFHELRLPPESLTTLTDAGSTEEMVRRLGRRRGVLGRRVDLEDGWWRSNGEILVVEHKDAGPCVLVPKNSGWKCVHPDPDSDSDSRNRMTVNAGFAAQCEPTAYEFMRSPDPRSSGIPNLLAIALRGRLGEIRARIVAGIVSALLGLVIPIMTAVLIDQVIPDGESRGVIGIGLALFVVAGATATLNLIGGLATLRLDNSVSYRVEASVLSRVVDRFRRDDELPQGEVIQRITSVNSAMGVITHSTDKVVVEAIRGFAHLFLLLYYSWVLAIIALATLAIGLILIAIESMMQNRFVASAQIAAGRAEDLSIQILGGLGAVRDRDLSDPLLLRWTAHRAEFANLTYRSSTIGNLRTLTLTILGGSSLVLVYGLVANGDAGQLSSGEFVASTIAIAAVMSSLGKVAGVVAALAVIAPIFQRLSPLLRSSPDPEGTDRPTEVHGAFQLEAVDVVDRNWGRNDLTACTVTIRPGSFTVIAAERSDTSEAILQVMLGLRTPDAGRVALDGRRLMNLDTPALRDRGVVMIEVPGVLPVSLRKNVDAENLISDRDLMTAMKTTGLDDVVDSLPLGLHTILDPRRVGRALAVRLAATRCLLGTSDYVVLHDRPVLRNNAWGLRFIDTLLERSGTRIIATTDPQLLARADRILVFDDHGVLVADGDRESIRTSGVELPPRIAKVIA
ncbi:MAG: ABC transporter transmembrane domain-containing protein [Phycisphaerales bacterium]|nr:ABC transporter transmembrane domain-containing protein [Phycisphaerales bacterium]